MPTLDATGRALAKNLINDKGRTVTLTREARTFSASTGKVSSVNTSYTVKISPPFPFDQTRINDTTVLEGDMECIIAADGLAVVPSAQTDKLTMSGSIWQIVAVSPIASGELDAAYTLQLRQ